MTCPSVPFRMVLFLTVPSESPTTLRKSHDRPKVPLPDRPKVPLSTTTALTLPSESPTYRPKVPLPSESPKVRKPNPVRRGVRVELSLEVNRG